MNEYVFAEKLRTVENRYPLWFLSCKCRNCQHAREVMGVEGKESPELKSVIERVRG